MAGIRQKSAAGIRQKSAAEALEAFLQAWLYSPKPQNAVLEALRAISGDPGE